MLSEGSPGSFLPSVTCQRSPLPPNPLDSTPFHSALRHSCTCISAVCVGISSIRRFLSRSYSFSSLYLPFGAGRDHEGALGRWHLLHCTARRDTIVSLFRQIQSNNFSSQTMALPLNLFSSVARGHLASSLEKILLAFPHSPVEVSIVDEAAVYCVLLRLQHHFHQFVFGSRVTRWLF